MTIRIAALALLLSTLLATGLRPVTAATLSQPEEVPPAGLALVGGTVHVGDGERVIERGTVLIRGTRLLAVGGNLRPAPGMMVIDVSGHHVTPGLIAPNTSLGLVEIGAVRATRDTTEVGVLNPHVRAWTAVNPDSELLGVVMANGILHAAVVPAGGLVSGTSGLIALQGWTREDMTVAGPAALHVRWPSMRIDRSPDVKPSVKKQERRLADRLEKLSDLFERARVYRRARAAANVPARERDPGLEAIVPVLDGDIPVVVHAARAPELRAALRFAEDQGVRLVLAGARDGWRLAEEIARAEVPVIVQPVRALPTRDHEPYDAPFTNPLALHRAGVKISFSVGGAAHVRNLPDEAAMAVAHGLDPEAALRAITLSPAEIYGVDDETGSLVAGKQADVVVWTGPPLEITSSVSAIVLRGQRLPLDDRHSRLYRKYRARPVLGR